MEVYELCTKWGLEVYSVFYIDVIMTFIEVDNGVPHVHKPYSYFH